MDIPKMKRKDFIQFLEKKEKYLEDLEQMIKVYKKDDGFKLSYQLNTIDIIQELYFNIANAKYKVDIPDHEIRYMFWSYLGEAVIHNLGGDWTLAPNGDEAAGTPVIENWGNTMNRPRISPFVWENLLIKGRLRENISRLILRMQGAYDKL